MSLPARQPAAAPIFRCFEGVGGVILDLDGTLYDQRAMRRMMALQLLRFFLPRPWLVKDLLILFHFRRLRERLADAGGGDAAQRQFAVAAQKCRCSVRQVETVVDQWLYRRPLRLLPCCRYPFVDTLLSWLAKERIMVAVLSDHPTHEKLKALGLGEVFSCASTDAQINRLKPDPAGLLHICTGWGLAPEQCLVIGDRDDRDGEAARRAGMRYLVVPDGLAFRTMEQFEACAARSLSGGSSRSES